MNMSFGECNNLTGTDRPVTSIESSRDQEGPESMHCDLYMQASYTSRIHAASAGAEPPFCHINNGEVGVALEMWAW